MIRYRFSSRHLAPAGAFLLAVIIAVVYGPSLFHVARGDQINYLAEMSSRHGFVQTVLGTFDINRTRVFGAGDEIAFRPVLFLILGLQKYLFGYAFMAWQAVALLAHVFVCGALYALLCRIRGGSFAWLATGLFAVAPVNIEAVTWHHITPYLFFAGCVLMALRGLHAAQQDEARARAHTAAAVGWMVPAVFLYETGVFYAVCMGVFLWLRGRRSAAGVLAGLVVLYAGASVADLFWRHADAVLQAGEVARQGSLPLTAANMALLVKWFLSAFFFLAPSDLIPVTRMMVRPEVVGWAWPWGQAFTLATGMGLAALTASIVLVLQGAVRRGVGKNAGLLALCLVMIAGYLAVIAAGRVNIQGEFALRVGLYYPYNFLTLAIVAAALLSSGARAPVGVPGRLVRIAGACIITAAIISGGVMTRGVTVQMARDHRNNRLFLAALDRYVKAHEKEPGFSFYVGPDYPGNYSPDWVARRGDPPGRVYTVAEALYFPQFTRDNPRYVIVFQR